MENAVREGLLELEHYYLFFSGFYMIQSIVAPYLYFRRIDYNFLYRWLAHEIEHYNSTVLGHYSQEFKLEEKIDKHMSLKGDYTLIFLYTCLSDLRNEGIAEYRKHRDTTRVLVSPVNIRRFRRLVSEIPKIKKKDNLEQYYDKVVYAGSKWGVYFCGKIMCFFIAYSLDPGGSRIVFPNGFTVGLERLPYAFSTNQDFFITPPSKKAYTGAFTITNRSGPVQFLKEYEQACEKLGLKGRSMVLTMGFFERVWKEGEYIFEHIELEKIKKEGYYPTF